MKTKMMLLAGLAATAIWGCTRVAGDYVDLNSGKKIAIIEDKEKGYMVNAETKKPVYLYVDTEKRDTFYGRTGRRVNGEVKRNDNGMFMYMGDKDYVYKNGDYKLKVEADGDYKLKDGDYKLKVEEDGDMKVKKGDDYKKKVGEDGSIKIKDGDKKIKIDANGDRKVKIDD